MISSLERLGVSISRVTLTRYENQGLISSPVRGALGRGGGRWTDYPEVVVIEAYTAYAFMHGKYGDEEVKAFFGGKAPCLSPTAVKSIREYSIKYKERYDELENTLKDDREYEEIDKVVMAMTYGKEEMDFDNTNVFRFVELFYQLQRQLYELVKSKMS